MLRSAEKGICGVPRQTSPELLGSMNKQLTHSMSWSGSDSYNKDCIRYTPDNTCTILHSENEISYRQASWELLGRAKFHWPHATVKIGRLMVVQMIARHMGQWIRIMLGFTDWIDGNRRSRCGGYLDAETLTRPGELAGRIDDGLADCLLIEHGQLNGDSRIDQAVLAGIWQRLESELLLRRPAILPRLEAQVQVGEHLPQSVQADQHAHGNGSCDRSLKQSHI